MKDFYKEVRTAAVSTVSALCLLAAADGAAYAQGGGRRPSPSERRMERLNRQGEEYDRDKNSRDLKGEPQKPIDRRRARELAEQIKHDFEGLQESYNRIVRAMAAKEGFDSDSVFGAVAQIKKCSARLKTNLALPRPKDEKEEAAAEPRGEASQARMEDSLLALQKHIYGFVTNPLFESSVGLDLELAKKAGDDLDKIIELSERIVKQHSRAKASR